MRPLFGVLTIVIFLVATMGGLAWFFAIAGLTELRGWNRISIAISFLALAWLALSVDRLLARRAWGVRGRTVIAIVGVVVIRRWDRGSDVEADRPGPAYVPSRIPCRSRLLRCDRSASPHRGAAVFQLPYIPYPEAGPVVNTIDYDPLRPYLNTKHLRWSYGGMKGRAADWQAVTTNEPAEQMVQDIIATGFSGVLVDRNAYQDKGEAVIADLTRITGDPGFASDDDRWVFFDLGAPARSSTRRQHPRNGRRSRPTSSPRRP